MATKTAGGSMYSGLLQTNQELAKAKELESNALSIGLEQGAKPLQGYLMGLANEEKERENQLKEDQKSAIDQMNTMADTSSLLGDFDSVVTADAYITKNLLNDIAKDESLNQYEKAAKYKEAVDKFNKKVSKFSNDQELIAGYTGRIAKGNISGGVDITGDDYKIAKALSSGNFKISGDKYVIEGLTDSNVDSNRLKNLYLAEKTIDANATSGAIAALGSATTNRKDLNRDLREFSLNVGTVETARELLVDGLGVMNSELKGLNLGQLQALIVEKGDDIATQAFIAAQPPVLKPSTAALMAKDAGFVIKDAMQSGDFSFLMSKNARFGGEQILDANYSNGILSIATKDKDGDASAAFKTINLNTVNGQKQVGEIILSQLKGTATDIGGAISLFNDSYNQPKDPDPDPNSDPDSDPDPDPNKITGIMEAGEYPEYITNASTERINAADARKILGLRKGGAIPMPLLTHLQDNYSVIETDEETKKKKRVIAFTEKNLLEAAFNTNSKLKDSSGKFLGREKYNQNIKNNIKQGEDESTLLNNINIANVSGVVNNPKQYESEMRKLGILADSQTALEITPKDIAVLKYMKATGKTLKQSRTALADLQAKNADKAEAAMATG